MNCEFLSLRRLFLGTLLCFASLPGFVTAQKFTGGFVKDELLVKFKDEPAAAKSREANRSLGTTGLDTLGDLGLQRVKLPVGSDINETIKRYKALENVEYVQPNFYYHLLATPNDPQFTNPGMYGLGIISAPAAWDLTTGSSSVVVANVDTGIRYTHEDLAANMWVNPGEIPGNGVDDDGNGFVDDYYGYDFFDNDPNPIDENGHGTHTAGTIGAVGNNLLGITGVNWNVKIMAIKIYDSTGFGTTSAMLINAYNYVRMMKNRGVNIRVTNNSYGGCDEACGYDQATKDAIDAMGEAGILNVFAAGNLSSNTDVSPFFPAGYTSPSILAVAASTSTDERAGFSNFGAETVDLAAPGSGILSTTFGSNSSYGISSGTSMATPHVAGAAALLAGHRPDLSAISLKATLMNSVDALPQWSGLVKTGGRLNILKALRAPTECYFIITADIFRVSTKGGYYSTGVSSPPNCDYFVKSNVNWIKIDGPDTRSGAANISFRVTVNPTIRRTGDILFGNIGRRTIYQSRDNLP